MCDCRNKTVDLQIINIYLLMNEYIKKEETPLVIWKNNVYFDFTKNTSQELLAYGYEELGLTDYIEKTIKDESKKAVKIKKSSKTSDSEK